MIDLKNNPLLFIQIQHCSVATTEVVGDKPACAGRLRRYKMIQDIITTAPRNCGALPVYRGTAAFFLFSHGFLNFLEIHCEQNSLLTQALKISA